MDACGGGTKIGRLKGPFEKAEEKNLSHIQAGSEKRVVRVPQQAAGISSPSAQSSSTQL